MRPVIGITADVRDGSFVLRRAYADAVARAGGYPLLLAPTLPEGGEFQEHAATLMERIDGLLIPGGGDIPPHHYGEETAVDESLLRPVSGERIRLERMLIDAVLRDAKPLLAICYGMQLLNVHLGGTLYQDLPSQRQGCRDHRESGHDIVCETLIGYPDGHSRCAVNSSHHQAVKSLGRGLETVARADDGVIEAIRLEGLPFVVGVQWHPERSDDRLSSHLFSDFVTRARDVRAARGAGD